MSEVQTGSLVCLLIDYCECLLSEYNSTMPVLHPGAIPSHFGEGTGPVWFNDVTCIGNETQFSDCLKNTTITTYCGYYDSQYAGVQCPGVSWVLLQ